MPVEVPEPVPVEVPEPEPVTDNPEPEPVVEEPVVEEPVVVEPEPVCIITYPTNTTKDLVRTSLSGGS